jgi:hypothetical protein
MKRMAGMQPYFFPYLGYWQLIAAVDCFVLFDEAQYIKQGWVNRNRILKPGGGWQYIVVPVAKHPREAAIRDVRIADDPRWRQRIFNQLAHYRKRAPHFNETMELVHALLPDDDDPTIGALNVRIVRQLCDALSLRTDIIVSSQYPFDYGNVNAKGDWALTHARALGANVIINPAAGIHMMALDKLRASNIALWALEPPCIAYGQPTHPEESSLSIIDVLMFNGIAGTRDLLAECTLRQVI